MLEIETPTFFTLNAKISCTAMASSRLISGTLPYQWMGLRCSKIILIDHLIKNPSKIRFPTTRCQRQQPTQKGDCPTFMKTGTCSKRKNCPIVHGPDRAAPRRGGQDQQPAADQPAVFAGAADRLPGERGRGPRLRSVPCAGSARRSRLLSLENKACI